MLQTADKFIEQMKNELGRNTSPRIYLYSYLFAKDIDRGAETSIGRALRLGISLRPTPDNIRPYLDHAGDIRRLSTSPLDHGAREVFLGRIIDPGGADIRLAMKWIGECEKEHGDMCETASRGDDVVYAALPPHNLRTCSARSQLVSR